MGLSNVLLHVDFMKWMVTVSRIMRPAIFTAALIVALPGDLFCHGTDFNDHGNDTVNEVRQC